MFQSNSDALHSLRETIKAFDETFSQDRGTQMGDFFSEDARLMWPMMQDIVGHERIRSAFEEFAATFRTISFRPDRKILEVCDNKAFAIGSFIEERAPRDGGPRERVYGRLVEMWSHQPDGSWKLDLVLTGRSAENVALG